MRRTRSGDVSINGWPLIEQVCWSVRHQAAQPAQRLTRRASQRVSLCWDATSKGEAHPQVAPGSTHPSHRSKLVATRWSDPARFLAEPGGPRGALCVTLLLAVVRGEPPNTRARVSEGDAKRPTGLLPQIRPPLTLEGQFSTALLGGLLCESIRDPITRPTCHSATAMRSGRSHDVETVSWGPYGVVTAVSLT